MDDLLTNVLAPALITVISAYVIYYFVIKRIRYERSMTQSDSEIERLEKLLYHAEKIWVAANYVQEE